jgi:hypothetical protein
MNMCRVVLTELAQSVRPRGFAQRGGMPPLRHNPLASCSVPSRGSRRLRPWRLEVVSDIG